ncbi:hypothetical protein CMUS01_06766 [Colletotrichum musicola]|uniref:Uncharacterized protein n=1 Tax=Colletotrichum musicola TaxID=2175873 RepID=A0A8H6KKZ2_9PEZI|nr:hypothetical protein CMUS01_06766 [Colletotrichum musicola]
MSNFFLEHEYHIDPLLVVDVNPHIAKGPKEAITRELQRYEDATNTKR